MSLDERLATAFGLDEAGWARHANPWSGWSRALTGLPVIVLAALSRIWLGWWALAVAVLAVGWLWLNPHLFRAPATDRAWMTRGVLGERLWVERKVRPLPETQTSLPNVLNAVSALGFAVMAYGLVVLDYMAVGLGGAVSWLAKMAFIDRTRVIYDAAVRRDPSLAYKVTT